MPEHTQTEPLLQVETSAFTFTASLMLTAAIACMVLQTMGLLDGINPEKSLAIQLIPGAVGVGLLVLFAFKIRQTGRLTVLVDKITGKLPNGLPVSIAIAEVAQVELNRGAIALKDAQGKLLLLQKLPQKADGGIVWLLKEYASWDPTIWRAYTRHDASPSQKATRHFMGDDTQVTFADVGFVACNDGHAWYLPESVMVDVRSLGASQIRMNQKSRSNTATLLQFHPSPDLLPLERLVTAILCAGLQPTEATDYLETLVEQHGGSRLKRHADSQEWDGYCLGYPVHVFPA